MNNYAQNWIRLGSLPGESGPSPGCSIDCSGHRRNAGATPGNGCTTARSTSKTWDEFTRPCSSSSPESQPSRCAGYAGRSSKWSSHWLKGRSTDPPVPSTKSRRKKTKVLWIEEIPPHRFYLRVGLGMKASGSYYTPHSFVRFLVQETLGPQVEERSPRNDPKPLEILKLKVLDPAMGSGHFLVEACRFLGENLYEACRSCDEKALEAERKAETANTNEKQTAALEVAQTWRQRIIELPDTDDELAKTEFVPRESKDQALEPVTGYLPSKSVTPGVATARAQAICRRLVAVHCLYGVDKNPLGGCPRIRLFLP